jgi:hypothetical protein
VPPEASLRDLWRTLERLGYAKFLSGLEEFVSAAAGMPARRSRRTTTGAPAIKGA